MSVDSLDTGTSVYSGEDIERLQSTIENQVGFDKQWWLDNHWI